MPPAGPVEVTGSGYEPDGLLMAGDGRVDVRQRPDLLALLETGLRCNHARVFKDTDGWHEFGEPTEAALVVAAYKAGLSVEDNPDRLSEFSFNSSRKRMTVIERRPEGLFAFSKGAPEIILERCTRILDGERERKLMVADRNIFTNACTRMAESGLRTLAFAHRRLPDDEAMSEEAVENELTLLGAAAIALPVLGMVELYKWVVWRRRACA